MTLFAPAYDHGEHKTVIIEHAEQLRPIGTRGSYCRYIPGVGFIGQIFHAETLFYTAEAVSRYWQKMPVPASERFTVAELVEAWDACKKV